MNQRLTEQRFAADIVSDLEYGRALDGKSLGIGIFPSLREEKNCGYDVKFDTPFFALFIQFKLSEARGERGEHWHLYNGKYYRFDIRENKKSHQHNILFKLSRESEKNIVFYCAPAFDTDMEYFAYKLSNEIFKHSAFIDFRYLSEICDGEKHCITFTEEPRKAHFNSVSNEIPVSFGFTECMEGKPAYENFEQFAETMKKVLNKTNINDNDILMKELGEFLQKNDIQLAFIQAVSKSDS